MAIDMTPFGHYCFFSTCFAKPLRNRHGKKMADSKFYDRSEQKGFVEMKDNLHLSGCRGSGAYSGVMI
jgi:hypothetical protein